MSVFLVVRRTVSRKAHVLHDVIGVSRLAHRALDIADRLTKGDPTAFGPGGEMVLSMRPGSRYEIVQILDLDPLMDCGPEHMRGVVDNDPGAMGNHGDEP